VRFNFRYESLLSYRERVKEQAEIDLAKARRQLREAREALGLYQKSLEQAGAAFQFRLRTRISSGEIKHHRDYLSGIEERIATQELEIRKRKELEKEKLKDLLTKTKQYRALGKLKEKDFKKWQQQQLQEEQKRMNEVAVTRHGRMSL